jgi:ubiquinone/menaquinone biosynthesis C-methylase UbiE
MEKVNIYKKAYHWKYKGFEEYVYLYPLNIIKKYLQSNHIGVDIGCGDCRITSILAKTIGKVYGVDNQIKPLQFAQRLVKAENLTLTQANCLRLPFKNSTFDVAFVFDVIEHIPFCQISQLLSEVCRILKKNGFMFLTTPNIKNTLRSKGKIPEKHHFELSYKEILTLLKNHNLKLIEFRGVYPRPFSKKWHRHIKKREYLYATMTQLGKWFPCLCDTFVVVAQC